MNEACVSIILLAEPLALLQFVGPVSKILDVDGVRVVGGLLSRPVADTNDDVVSSIFLFPLALVKSEEADVPEKVLIMFCPCLG